MCVAAVVRKNDTQAERQLGREAVTSLRKTPDANLRNLYQVEWNVSVPTEQIDEF